MHHSMGPAHSAGGGAGGPARRGPRSGATRTARACVAVLLAGAMLASIGCAGGSSQKSGEKALRVGVAPFYPPIVFEQEGRISGVEADLSQMVGASLGRPVEYVRMRREQLIPAIEAGGIDIAMSGMSITPERGRRVLFSEPYLYVGQLVLIRIADLVELSGANALRRPGVRIGYVDGTTGEAYVSQHLKGAQTYAFRTVDEGVRNLRAKRIDAFIHDAPTVWLIGADPAEQQLMGLYEPLTREALAWAVGKDQHTLKARLDEMIERWSADGELDRVLNRWIPVRVKVGP